MSAAEATAMKHRSQRGKLKRRVLETRAMVRELEASGAQVSWRTLDYGDVRLLVYSPRWGLGIYDARTLRAALRSAL